MSNFYPLIVAYALFAALFFSCAALSSFKKIPDGCYPKMARGIYLKTPKAVVMTLIAPMASETL